MHQLVAVDSDPHDGDLRTPVRVERSQMSKRPLLDHFTERLRNFHRHLPSGVKSATSLSLEAILSEAKNPFIRFPFPRGKGFGVRFARIVHDSRAVVVLCHLLLMGACFNSHWFAAYTWRDEGSGGQEAAGGRKRSSDRRAGAPGV